MLQNVKCPAVRSFQSWQSFKSTLLLLNFAVTLHVCEAQNLAVFYLCNAGIAIACPHFWLWDIKLGPWAY